MTKACVIGWPIGHSRSPLIHSYWLKKHGIPGSYQKLAVPPDQLVKFLDRIRDGEFAGCNVTIPHKESVAILVDKADERVARTGSANTLFLESGKLCATSSDGTGFMDNLQSTLPDFDPHSGQAVILGAGGSARAIVDEMLRRRTSQIIVCNRTRERAEALAEHFGPAVVAQSLDQLPQALANADLLVNTTAGGLNGQEGIAIPFTSMKQACVVADIVYSPLVTPLLQQAKGRGHRTVTGLGMLLHQAVVGFEKWFGIRPEVTTELYDLVARDIDANYQLPERT